MIPEPEIPSHPAADPGFAAIESVLVVHNRYRQWGGDDSLFDAETELLAAHGHRVERLIVDNDAIPDHPSASQRVRLAARTVWSGRAAEAVAERARAVRAGVVHIHNFVPLLSPAVHGSARSTGAAVVQTLHNYRLICPAATLFRDGAPCDDCVGRRVAMPAVVHACYRDSRAQTAVITSMLAVHRARRTWGRDVDAFVALTDFGRDRFVAGGLPADRIVVKPNFVADRDGGDPDASPDRRYAEGPFLFVGRLSPEKGVETLLEAWPHVSGGRSLRIVGDGPLASHVRSVAESLPGVTVVGPLSRDEVDREMRSAAALVFPSVWYEGMPITLIEALAARLPVIASRLGAMETMVEDGRTGVLVAPGDPRGLSEGLSLVAGDGPRLAAMGAAARAAYVATYAPDANYARLAGIYAAAVARRRGAPGT